MARICNKVPLYPAESFKEAIQSIWFVNYAFTHTMTYIPIGRIDYLLYPYFRMDYEKGRISLEEAQELVDSFAFMSMTGLRFVRKTTHIPIRLQSRVPQTEHYDL